MDDTATQASSECNDQSIVKAGEFRDLVAADREERSVESRSSSAEADASQGHISVRGVALDDRVSVASATRGRILIVDDDANVRFLFHKKLTLQGYKVEEAESIEQVLVLLNKRYFDAVLLDNYLGDERAIDSIAAMIKLSPTSHIIMLTAHGSIDSVVHAMSAGASAFLVKSDPPDTNISKLCQILDTRSFLLGESEPYRKLGIIGCSEIMSRIFAKISKVGPTDVTVLISGESGTGKELIARAIHETSPRFDTGPFIGINCGAITETLLEAELFGSKKGAYTGSSRDRKGYFETCHDGTLFLDEIGEMSQALQVKFLRVLQEREITPIGSCQPIKVNTRVIAATNCNLMRDIKNGRFREDLFYRLSVVTVELPPLRERTQDIPALIQHFVDKANLKFGKTVRYPSNQLLAKLRLYHWPGNVRELHNAVERAVLMAEDEAMDIEDLIPIRMSDVVHVEAHHETVYPLEYCEARQVFERKYIDQLLTATKGNIAEAARLSGQYRPAIYRLLKKYHFDASLYK